MMAAKNNRRLYRVPDATINWWTFASLHAEDREWPVHSTMPRYSPSNLFPSKSRWAKWYADFLDPLTPTPQREEYAVAPTNVLIAELELTRRTKQIVSALGVPDTNALYEVEHN